MGGRWLSPGPTYSRLLSAPPCAVPPSKPDCSILGDTVIGSDIQLTCQSKEGSPTPQYRWQSFDLHNQERKGPPGNRTPRTDCQAAGGPGRLSHPAVGTAMSSVMSLGAGFS